MISNLVAAVGLVFVIEGLMYAIAPNRFKSMISAMEDIPAEKLRILGVMAIALGVGIVWFAKTFITSS